MWESSGGWLVAWDSGACVLIRSSTLCTRVASSFHSFTTTRQESDFTQALSPVKCTIAIQPATQLALAVRIPCARNVWHMAWHCSKFKVQSSKFKVQSSKL